MESKELSKSRMQELKEKLTTFDDNDVVKVRISYLMDLLKILNSQKDGKLFYKSKYHDLYEFVSDYCVYKADRLKLLQSLKKNYIEMTVKECRRLLQYADDFIINKSMLVVFNYSQRHHGK